MSFWPFKNIKNPEPKEKTEYTTLHVNFYGFDVVVPVGASDSELATLALKQLRDGISADGTHNDFKRISRDGEGNILDVSFDVCFGEYKVQV